MSRQPNVGHPCRDFEDRLVRLLVEGTVHAACQTARIDAHVLECVPCGELVDQLAEDASLFSVLALPAPGPDFFGQLSRPPADLGSRAEADRVLGLLAEGALRKPEPSADLMSRLAFVPMRSRASAAARAREGQRQAETGQSEDGPVPSLLRRLFGDWRVLVATAYALSLLIVTVMRVDPLSVARGTASSLTSAGERAVVEARQVAQQRIAGLALANAARPMRDRFDYRLYRTVTAGRARAAAYSQLLFDKVFGGAFEVSAAAEPLRERRAVEPNAGTLRS